MLWPSWGQADDGTLTIQHDCHGDVNQQWSVESAGDTGHRIVSRLSSKWIGTDPEGVAVGGHIVQSQQGVAGAFSNTRLQNDYSRRSSAL
jgi:Ricin-type beta-trefoil lectin domain-like